MPSDSIISSPSGTAITSPTITTSSSPVLTSSIPELVTLSKCACCSNELEEDGSSSESVDGLICRDCRDDVYFTCTECEEVHHNDDALCPSDDLYCSTDCAREAGWFMCSDCSTWEHEDNSYRDDHDNSICQSCADNYYSCVECDNITHVDNCHYEESSGDNYCQECWRGRDTNRVIKDYGYKPREYAFDKMAWENTTFLGIELELECNSNHSPLEKAGEVLAWLEKHGHKDKVYIKEDGSLQNGFEIVFMPTTLKAFHKKFPMRSFLRYLQDLKLTSHNKGTCGLHVHLSKNGLGSTDRERDLSDYKGKLFFYRCQWYLKRFSARADGDKDDPWHYCKFDASEPSRGKNEYGHFSAYNTKASRHTSEIRIFRGTLIYDRFLASLQFSDAFSEFIQVVSVAFIRNNTREVVWGCFMEFCKKSAKWGQFVKYVIKKGII